jgi:hypothetical protein
MSKEKIWNWQEVFTFGSCILGSLGMILFFSLILVGCTTPPTIQNLTCPTPICNYPPEKICPEVKECQSCPTCQICETCKDTSILQDNLNQCFMDKHIVEGQLENCQGGFNISENCQNQLADCNETVSRYLGIINNASYELNRNR